MAGAPKRNHGKICGAHARSTGKPCQMRNLLPNGRCRLHGSGGPRTEAGKARAIRNLIEHRGPKTGAGRQKILEALDRGRATAIQNRKKQALRRKQLQEFEKQYARARHRIPARVLHD